MKPVFEFIFLDFDEDPIRRLSFTDEELEAFEDELVIYYKQMLEFSVDDIEANMAAHQGFPEKDEGFCKSLLCGFAKTKGQLKKDGTPMYHCIHKFPYEYYSLCDEDGGVIKSSFEQDLVPDKKRGQFVIRKKHLGCPAFNKKKLDFAF